MAAAGCKFGRASRRKSVLTDRIAAAAGRALVRKQSGGTCGRCPATGCCWEVHGSLEAGVYGIE